jgi:hypothetical protein
MLHTAFHVTERQAKVVVSWLPPKLAAKTRRRPMLRKTGIA